MEPVRVHADHKFKHGEENYLVTFEPKVLKQDEFRKIIKTNAQAESLFAEVFKQGIISRAEENGGLSSITFLSKEKQCVFFFAVKKSTQSQNIKANVKIYRFAYLDEQCIATREEAVKKENQFELKEYTLPYYIITRPTDYLLISFSAYGTKFKACLSNYAVNYKSWFITKYDIEKFLISAGSVFHQEGLIQEHLDKEPFLVCVTCEDNEETFGITFSLSTVKYKGETFCNILLDNIHKQEIQFAIDAASKLNEKIYTDLGVKLKKRPRANSIKKPTGLKINILKEGLTA